MEKFEWKKHLKESFSGFMKELFSFMCILIASVIIVATQTRKELEAIAMLFNENDFVIIALILFGIIAFGFLIESTLKGVFKIVKIIFSFIWQRKQ